MTSANPRAGLDVAICSDMLPGLTIGGRESRLLQLGPVLKAAGVSLRLITLERAWQSKPVAGAFEVRTVARAARSDEQRKRSWLNGLRLAGHTAAWLLGNSADVVELDQIPHAALPLALAACRLSKKRAVVHWIEAWSIEDWRGYLGPILGTLAFAGESLSFRCGDAMAISEFTARRLRQIHGRPEKPISVVPPGFANTALLAARPVKQYQLGFAGRLLPHKRVDRFLTLVAEVGRVMPEIKAVVVGEGEDLPYARRLAEQLGCADRVEFTGKIERHQDVLSLIGTMELLILCSEREGFGLTVLEANAQGVPVLLRAGEANGSVELIEDGVNGFVCHSDGEMAARAIEVLSRASVKEHLRAGAVDAARGYSEEAVVAKLLAAYSHPRSKAGQSSHDKEITHGNAERISPGGHPAQWRQAADQLPAAVGG